MICSNCGKEYPDKFIHPFRSLKTKLIQTYDENGDYHPDYEKAVEINVDPICALKLKSELHGRIFRKFQTDSAQKLLEDFRSWKRASASKKKRAAAKAKAKKTAKTTKAKKTVRKQTKTKQKRTATATA